MDYLMLPSDGDSDLFPVEGDLVHKAIVTADHALGLFDRLLGDQRLLEALDFDLAGGPPKEPALLDCWGTGLRTRGLAAARAARR